MMKVDNAFTLALYVLTTILLIVSFLKDRTKTKLALKRAWKMFLSVLPQFLSILLLIGIMLAYIQPDTVQRIIGTESHGTYRITVIYVISGSGGDPDTITKRMTKTY